MTGLEFIAAARAFAGEPIAARDATLDVGRRIVNSELAGGATAGVPFSAGEQVYAHPTISGHGAGVIEHVWLRDGVEVARHYMPVGDDRRWRTWSRHRLATGAYRVELYGPDGRQLLAKSFSAS